MTAPHAHPVYLRFDRRFQNAVASGAKPFTLRGGSARNYIDLGDQLELAPPAGAAFATAVCVFRARVVITRDALVRVLDPRILPGGEALSRLFEQAEQAMPDAAASRDRLAALDGFDTWADLFDYQAKHGSVIGGQATREVVGWADVASVKLAEVDAALAEVDAALAGVGPDDGRAIHLAMAAQPLIDAIATYSPSAGEDDDELVSVRLGDLKHLQRVVTGQFSAAAA